MIDINIKIDLPSLICGKYTRRKDEKLKIKRRNKKIEIGFPSLSSKEVKLAAILLKKSLKQSHDRTIRETVDILNQVYNLWINPNYEIRKEAEEILSIVTGQSKRLIKFELNEVIKLFEKENLLKFLGSQIDNIDYLDQWIKKGDIFLHAQPKGSILHNLAGNAFVLGPISLLYGIITKNVNLAKIASTEPYFVVRFIQSIYDVDKKFARELAVIYWKGGHKDIYKFLFDEELIDGVIAWGGYKSISNLKKLSAHYGVKFIEHGPKFSFSIITSDFLGNTKLLEKASKEIAKDIVIWNQYACTSPRIIFVQEKKSLNFENPDYKLRQEMIGSMKHIEKNQLIRFSNKQTEYDSQLMMLMSESVENLRKVITHGSAIGFAKLLSIELEKVSKYLPRTYMTEAEAMNTLNKRDYYILNVESKGWGKIFIPSNSQLVQNTDWTIFYLRKMPELIDIDYCINRFIIITPFTFLEEIEEWIKQMQIQKYIQTFSIFGKMKMVKKLADKLSFLGACIFTLPGEMNVHKYRAPHDGSYDLKELVRWVSINFLEEDLNDFTY
ncbi:MAG: acyl-CoA reductase [Promethearchaeota archaeon]